MTEASTIPCWTRFATSFASSSSYSNPLQQAELTVDFTAPSGRIHRVYGFWDGDDLWRVRFLPDEIGPWRFHTSCSDAKNAGLHDVRGEFICSASVGDNAQATPFARHGPVHVADSGRHLAHADGTPFFWLADTCWNGPLRSTDDEWRHYLAVRSRQKFTAVQWVGTQWISAPDGDIRGRLPFSGHEEIAVDPAVFQRLDAKQDAINQAGLLSVPVLLWAAEWGPPEVMAVNPGLTLPETQCILLARYMVARWGANAVAWILPGDGLYTGERAARWQRIGRAVFGEIDHAPVTLHPSGLQWYGDEFNSEPWMDFIGYQSCHFSDDESLSWIVNGPPARAWRTETPWPVINLEPNYEAIGSINDHDYAFDAFDAFDVRRAAYWSLLVSPTAGVSYGAHGLWGWDDGSGPAVAHPDFGRALPWQEALQLPGGGQMTVLHDFFADLPWPTLRPAPELLAQQPGEAEVGHTITVARSEVESLVNPDRNPYTVPTRDRCAGFLSRYSRRTIVVVAYLPAGGEIALSIGGGRSVDAQWVDPRQGERTPAVVDSDNELVRFTAPSTEDWLLLCTL